MDKGKIAIVGGGVLIIGIIIFWFMSIGGKEQSEDEYKASGFEIPDKTAKENFDKRLKAYSETDESKSDPLQINLEELNYKKDSVKKVSKPDEELNLTDEKKGTDVKPQKAQNTKVTNGNTKTYQKQNATGGSGYTPYSSTKTNSKKGTKSQTNSTVVVETIKKEQKNEEVEEERKGFYSSESTVKPSNSKESISCHAVIHGEQTLRNNEKIKLRTTEEMTIDGQKIPKNTIILGAVNFSGNRMNVAINGFGLNNQIVESILQVYDLRDGEKGLLLEQVSTITKDAANEGMNKSTGGTTISSPIFSISTDALKKKANEKSVIVPNNYKIILKKS